MQPNLTALGITPVVVANGLTTAPFPPLVAGGNVSNWNNLASFKSVPEFDLEIWAAASVSMTAAELFGGALHAGTIAGSTFTVVHGTDIVTTTAGLLHTGDGPFRLTTSGVLPAGSALATDYYWYRLSDTTGYFCSSLANALAGTSINMTGNGTGTHTLTGTADTKLMYMHSCGLLGNAADGAITLTARRAYNVRVNHRPNVMMYWISATFTGTIFCTIYPVTSS